MSRFVEVQNLLRSLSNADMISFFYRYVVFFSPFDALAVFETTALTLTSIEQAANLGFGIWLITSANADFTLCESSSLATSSSSRLFAGCHICIITHACGTQIHMGHIIRRSDLASS